MIHARSSPSAARVLLCLLLGGVLMPLTARAGPDPQTGPVVGTVVPVDTKFRFHTDTPLSSATDQTGQYFTFTLDTPIMLGGRLIAAAGAHGSGTLLLAGHSGNEGHEGDLTLHLETIETPNGRVLSCDERLEINGRKRALLSDVLNFVPTVGPAAIFIHGVDSTVTPQQVLNVQTTKPARVVGPAESETEAAASQAPSIAAPPNRIAPAAQSAPPAAQPAELPDRQFWVAGS